MGHWLTYVSPAGVREVMMHFNPQAARAASPVPE